MQVECAHGYGNAQGPRTTRGVVGAAYGTAQGCESSVLSTLEPTFGGELLRRVRGRTVPAVLCREAGTAEPRAGGVLPAAADRLFRGHRLGAWDSLAGQRLAGLATFPAGGAGGIAAGPFHDLAHATIDRCGDPRGSVHLGVGSAGGEGATEGRDAGDRRHHAGGERGVADDCAAGHGRRIPGVSEAAGRGVRNQDPDARTVGATGPEAGAQGVEGGGGAPP